MRLNKSFNHITKLHFFLALRHERQWPDTLVKVYIEDAIGERIWVDHPDCKGFVENICTAFDTKMPTSNIFFATGTGSKATVGEGGISGRESPGVQGSGSRSGSGSATPTRPGTDDDSQVWILLMFSIKLNLIFKLGYIFSNLDLELLCVDARMYIRTFSEAVLKVKNLTNRN